MELRKKRVLVVGLARTGVATALFCSGHNAIVTATETRAESELEEAPAKLRAAGVTLELGGHTEKNVSCAGLDYPKPRRAGRRCFSAAGEIEGHHDLE